MYVCMYVCMFGFACLFVCLFVTDYIQYILIHTLHTCVHIKINTTGITHHYHMCPTYGPLSEF